MEQTITINLPSQLYQKLQRTAELAHQPTEIIIAQSLRHTLPPLLEDIPLDYQPNVYSLLQLNVNELRYEVQKIFPPEQWSKYEWLLEQKKLRELTTFEKRDLETLRREADILALRKGYAAVLLKRRGYAVPVLESIS